MSIDRRLLRLYAVTDRSCMKTGSLTEAVREALDGGATLIQLREKNMPFDEFLSSAKSMKRLCAEYGVPLIINDNIDVAIGSDADGIHLGQDDITISRARTILGKNKVIGATAKTPADALKAQEDGADYIGSGAIFGSATKPNAKKMDIYTLKSITQSVQIPVVAIGGITEDNIMQLRGTGIAGAAVVSGIFASSDIVRSTKILYKRIGEII